MKFREWLLSENKQEIIALGFPKVIADILYENFGKNAFQIAKWNKDYSGFKDKENWWIMTNSSYSMRTLGLADYVRLYEGTKDVESFKKAFYHVYEKEPKIEEYELEEQRDFFKKRIEEDLLNSTFFDYLMFFVPSPRQSNCFQVCLCLVWVCRILRHIHHQC